MKIHFPHNNEKKMLNVLTFFSIADATFNIEQLNVLPHKPPVDHEWIHNNWQGGIFLINGIILFNIN